MRVLARAFAAAAASFLAVALLGIGLFFYAFSIPEPEGRSLASWPNRFTENYSTWLHWDGRSIEVDAIGLDRLDEYGLWLQVLDENGVEVYAHGTPAGLSRNYSAAELSALESSPFDGAFTRFVGTAEELDGGCYLIGFPYPIGKSTVYYNGETTDRIYSIAFAAVAGAAVLLVAGLMAYGVWLSLKLRKMTTGIVAVSKRTYEPQATTGTFSSAIGALNDLDASIERSDEARRETERIRREWVENITHDLRTPLSSIRGHAELLASEEGRPEEAQVILRNTARIGALVDDLRLSYDLEGGRRELKKTKVSLERIARECAIDLVNSDRSWADSVLFSSSTGALVEVDTALLCRALGNIMANALSHNPAGTRVSVTVRNGSSGEAEVEVADNGEGIPDDEIPRLFERYWRGSQTGISREGSGLGLAIARDIIELHGGSVSAHSREGSGTVFLVKLPSFCED